MEKDIGKLRKNPDTEIVVRIDDFGGKKGLTIREFVTSERYTGFTKAGVRISAGDFKKFKEMINSIHDADLKEEASQSNSQEELPDYWWVIFLYSLIESCMNFLTPSEVL